MSASASDTIAPPESALFSASRVVEADVPTRVFGTFVAVDAVNFTVAAGVRGPSQALVVYLPAVVSRVAVNLDPPRLLGMVVLIVPIFFASNATYPLNIMPARLRMAAHANPLTYEVDAPRALMIRGAASVFGLPIDYAVLALVFPILLGIAARLYGRMGE